MTETKNTELLNCPFCGNQPEQHQNSHSGYWFTCDNDDCAFNLVRKSRKDAVDDWNKRVQTDRGQAGDWNVILEAKRYNRRECFADNEDGLMASVSYEDMLDFIKYYQMNENQLDRLKEAVRDLNEELWVYSYSEDGEHMLHDSQVKHKETIKEVGE